MEGLKKPTGGYWGHLETSNSEKSLPRSPKGTSEETVFLEPDMKYSNKERLPKRRYNLRDAVTARTKHNATG